MIANLRLIPIMREVNYRLYRFLIFKTQLVMSQSSLPLGIVAQTRKMRVGRATEWNVALFFCTEICQLLLVQLKHQLMRSSLLMYLFIKILLLYSSIGKVCKKFEKFFFWMSGVPIYVLQLLSLPSCDIAVDIIYNIYPSNQQKVKGYGTGIKERSLEFLSLFLFKSTYFHIFDHLLLVIPHSSVDRHQVSPSHTLQFLYSLCLWGCPGRTLPPDTVRAGKSLSSIEGHFC